MRCTLAALALPLLAAAAPQGVTSAIAPSSTAPAGCSPNYSGKFEIEIVNVTTSTKRDLNKRQDVALVVTLVNGVLTDAKGRTGYIAANNQFQFDGPPQTGAIYTAGWSVCSNGSLALGGSAIFYECLSAPFYNLYDESIGDQCAPIYIDVLAAPASGAASQTADGQVTASPVASQISDGQVTASPVTQISDGQIQATTGAPVTQISDGQIQATTGAPVTQISDGQIQATTGAPVTQISDGQIQATTGAPVTQISDGQIQATTGSPVTQISDGQIQAPTRTGAPVSQISDGQIQAPTGRNGTVASPSASVVPFTPGTNAAAPLGVRNAVLGLAAGVVAVALL